MPRGKQHEAQPGTDGFEGFLGRFGLGDDPRRCRTPVVPQPEFPERSGSAMNGSSASSLNGTASQQASRCPDGRATQRSSAATTFRASPAGTGSAGPGRDGPAGLDDLPRHLAGLRRAAEEVGRPARPEIRYQPSIRWR
ncbi:hypothetical protein [Amycolatopsis sp. lyj-346]|uniref:hypothetical protein n=1 Tax=Amycolatopsis sp. lyj-346 TaxID=2789289 RepID=UPI003979D90E